MKKLISIALIVMIPVLTCQAAVQDDDEKQPRVRKYANPEAPYEMIAPEFGGLLANYMLDLWMREIAPQKWKVCLLNDDSGMLTYDILYFISTLSKKDKLQKDFYEHIQIVGFASTQDKLERMQLRNKRFDNFKAVLKGQTDSFNLNKNEKGTVLLIYQSANPVLLDVVSEDQLSQFKLERVLDISEFEFLKDHKGRQELGLDQNKSLTNIYERLVRRSLTPLIAKAVAQQSIEQFRNDHSHYLAVFSIPQSSS